MLKYTNMVTNHGRPSVDAPSFASPLANRSLRKALFCLLMSGLLCGCASGMMSLPGATMLAERFSRDDDKEKSEEKPSKDKKSSKREKEEDNDFGTRVETPLLSEYMSVQGNTVIVLRGVGLVTGLNGTGGDPSPSALRTQLQNEMTRRNVKNVKQILASRDTAMVIVTAYLPAMVRKNQRFDVRVALPKNSNATSLKGGWLLDTRLFEEQTVEGRGTLKGHEYAVAGGAILTSLGVKDNRDERKAELMSGTIPGGALSKTDRDLSIVLRTDKRGSRNSERVANAVSGRFHRYNKYGQKISCAEAKTDALVTLKTHEQYINNFPRYQAVIRSLALNESEVARRIRLEMLARDILDPDKCQSTSLQLEAIGDDAIPFLKDALESESFEVRFQAAQTLAYLGNASGVSILKEAVSEQPAFRIYALVALSVIDDADAVLALRELMSEPTLETRYGAFRSLKELDPRDPWLNPLAFENRFVLYVIDSQGEPMVHVTRRRAPEIVVFGSDQPLRLPAILNAGRNIRVKGESGSHEVEVIFYKLNEEPERQKVPNRLIDIIRVCGQLGATYPDMVQLMIEAEQQHNFVGQFGIDRLPQAGRLYVKEDASSMVDEDVDSEGQTKRIGNSKMLPELFDELDEEEMKENESNEKLMSINFENVAKQDAKTAARMKSPEQGNADNASAGGDEDGESSDAPGDPVEGSTSDDDAAEGGHNVEGEAADAGSESPDRESASDTTNSMGEASKDSSATEADKVEAMDEEESVETSEPKASFGSRWLNKIRKPFGGLSEPEP